MISKLNFEKEHIEDQLKKYPKVDPTKMEMTIFAFGLLDQLIRCGVPLIFKGGTSLLLLLENPQRISTDIDIIVPLDFDFDKFFEKVKKRFPFYEGEERAKNPNKHFRHFYFMFYGPITNRECRINLDVAFEDNPYPNLIEKEITLDYILVSGEKTFVKIPTHESIIGDKLTAFAPTTIGVNPFKTSLGKKIDNRLQVMKQFYDIARLYDYIENIMDVLKSYKQCHKFENMFRGVEYTIKETLMDTFNHAAEIASMGLWNKKSNFFEDVVRVGVQGLSSNVFTGKYTLTDAANDAVKIMHLVACLLTDNNLNERVEYKGNYLKMFKSISSKNTFSLLRNSFGLLANAKILK